MLLPVVSTNNGTHSHSYCCAPLESDRFDETYDDNYDDDDLTLGDGDEHNMLQESGEWARRMRRPSAAKLVLFTSVGAKPPPTSRIHRQPVVSTSGGSGSVVWGRPFYTSKRTFL